MSLMKDKVVRTLLLAALISLLPLPSASGFVPSNQFQIRHQDVSGTSGYTIFYYVPPTARTGSNLNVSVLLYVDTLTGIKLYVRDYGLTVAVDLGGGHTIISSANVSVDEQKWLYPGGRWGPLNISLPLTEQDTGLAPGQAVRANVTISLLATIWYDSPIFNYLPESGDGRVGSVYVQGVGHAVSGSSTIVSFLLITGGAVLLVSRVVIFRRRHNEP